MLRVPLTSQQVLDRYFLEVRARLLEVAASLDRMDRAGGRVSDPRREKIDEALRILGQPRSDRAEQLQLLFSREYDPAWIEGFEPAKQ